MNANLPALQRGSHAGKHAFRSATEVFLARLKASAATPLADSSAESEKCIKYMKALHNCLLYTARCGQAGLLALSRRDIRVLPIAESTADNLTHIASML